MFHAHTSTMFTCLLNASLVAAALAKSELVNGLWVTQRANNKSNYHENIYFTVGAKG